MKDILICASIGIVALLLVVGIFMTCCTEDDGVRSNQNASEMRLLQLCFDIIDGVTPAKL